MVVFTYPDQPHVSYVKRVIGLPGDRIQIIKGEVSVNDQKLNYEVQNSEESHQILQEIVGGEFFQLVREVAPEGNRLLLVQKSGKSSSFGPLVVPPNEVFLLGDNRDSSDDSRHWGTVPIERI